MIFGVCRADLSPPHLLNQRVAAARVMRLGEIPPHVKVRTLQTDFKDWPSKPLKSTPQIYADSDSCQMFRWNISTMFSTDYACLFWAARRRI